MYKGKYKPSKYKVKRHNGLVTFCHGRCCLARAEQPAAPPHEEETVYDTHIEAVQAFAAAVSPLVEDENEDPVVFSHGSLKIVAERWSIMIDTLTSLCS